MHVCVQACTCKCMQCMVPMSSQVTLFCDLCTLTPLLSHKHVLDTTIVNTKSNICSATCMHSMCLSWNASNQTYLIPRYISRWEYANTAANQNAVSSTTPSVAKKGILPPTILSCSSGHCECPGPNVDIQHTMCACLMVKSHGFLKISCAYLKFQMPGPSLHCTNTIT